METTTKNDSIQLVTKPKIVHRLQELGAGVTKRLQDLNIENLVATEDSVKFMKELRAELNKELDTYEEQRKLVKEGVLNPYNEFNTVYEIEISGKYKSAITQLKDKIGVVEMQIKDRKKAAVKLYFDELCISERVDFVPFEKVIPEINLSTTEKAYKDKCNEFISKTIDDLILIKTTEFEAEILVDYKISLNAAQAITAVKSRKEKEKEEKARILQVEINRRLAKMKSIAMIYDDFTKTFVYDDEIFITYSFLHDSSAEEFSTKFIWCEEKIKEIERAKVADTAQPSMEFKNNPDAPSFKAPIGAPITIITTATEETVIAAFEVTGTMAQLKALGQYMRDNKITYKNI